MNGQESRERNISKGARVLYWMLVMGTGIFTALVALNKMPMGAMPVWVAVAMVLVMLWVAKWVQILLHETGHLLFGWLTGYTLVSFRLGKFIWLRLNGKLRLHGDKKWGVAGQCLMIPKGDVQRFPYVLYNLGGCLANLFWAGLASYLYAQLPLSLGAAFLGVFALQGVEQALLNGLPFRWFLGDNDGRNLLAMKKNQLAKEAFWYQLQIYQKTIEDVRLKDMPEEWFRVSPHTIWDSSLLGDWGVLAFERSIDQKDFGRAWEIGQELLRYPSVLTAKDEAMFDLEWVYLEMLRGEAPEKVNRDLTPLLKQWMEKLQQEPDVQRIAYTYALLIEQDEPKAEQIRWKFEKLAENSFFPNAIEAQREQMSFATKLAQNIAADDEASGDSAFCGK